ncbi:sensor histidine kinase [Rufibacter ruber]|uniref:sensor histidine kinase n=1 Tax=Rufibacter ruber TaxID=1783499 RepID=UPI000830DDA0|nr:HAMP domain-containing sensor histidine kinase [Rufibacter ruber]
MKLLNRATAYFAVLLLVVLSAWAALFYYNMLDEIYDSIDDGLENQKILVMQKALQDSTVLAQREFEAGYYQVKELPFNLAVNRKDQYRDTLMYMLNEKDYEPVRLLVTVFQQGGRYYELRVITSMVEEDDLIEDLLYSLLWLYLGLLVSLLTLNNLVLKSIWQPFYQILHRLQRFRLEKGEALPPVKTNIEEFRLLHETVDKLLQSNIDTYNSQKAFIENASHELQTPLAISLNKLELLVEKEGLTEEQMLQLGAVMQHLGRLSRLNKSLLLLSKIENRQFQEMGPVNLQEIVRQALADLGDQIEYKELQVSVQEEPCLVQVNPDLATVLVYNLLKNAVVHNVQGGFLNLHLTAQALVLENSGKDQALDTQKLFSRFYKEASVSGSTGLGLAIAKAICDLYGFSIRYRYQQAHLLEVTF